MKWIIISYLIFLFSELTAQSPFHQAIETLANDPVLKHGSLGVAVIDVSSGKLLAQHHQTQSLIPASALKIVTTASALKLLGANYRFKTELLYEGNISNGVLRGNLILKGFGDPTLGSDQMEGVPNLPTLMAYLVKMVQKAGIKEIQGKVIGDASFFRGETAGNTWQWYDLGNYYATGTWGLNIHENFYYLDFQQANREGETPKIARIEPLIPNLYFINEVTSAPKNTGDQAYIYGGPYAYARVIKGTIPVGNQRFTIKGSIPDPPFFAAHRLLYALEEAGIKTTKLVQTDVEWTAEKNRTLLFTHYSPTLAEIVKRANYESVNLYCESMIRAIGAAKNATNSLEGGIEAILAYWTGQGLDTEGIFLMDGSGLSPRTGISAYQMATILQLIANDEALFSVFYNTLPLGGQSGTVKSLFKGSTALGKIRLKSGYIERARSFAGYVEHPSGKRLAFAVIANNYTCTTSTMTKKLEQLMIKMCQ